MQKECKGIFWRGSVKSFLSSYKSIEHRKSLRLLKRKSCKGCISCEWIWEYFQEDTNSAGDLDYLKDIKQGALYTYAVHMSRGFEELYDEIDYIDFVEVKDE